MNIFEIDMKTGVRCVKIKVIEESGISTDKMGELFEYGQNQNDNAVLMSEYEYNILESVEIAGLSKAEKEIINGQAYMFFPIYSYISLRQRFEKELLNVEIFHDFFRQLWDVYENMKLYLLDANSIELCPEWIFYDEQKGTYFFLPIGNRQVTITDKFEKLFTFLADVCPITEPDLLEFIFENFSALSDDSFEPDIFIKYIIGYKIHIEELNDIEDESENDFEFAANDNNEEISEKKKMCIVSCLSIVLLMIAFGFTYLTEYEFKYSVLGITMTFLAIILMAYQVSKMVKEQRKNPIL